MRQLILTFLEEMVTIGRESEYDILSTMVYLLRRTASNLSTGDQTEGSLYILRDRIKSYVERNLRDPQLKVDQIATALKCSKRYLYKAFEGEKLPIARYIWRERLERCHEDLWNPAYQNESITEIAFCWGFNSSHHFGVAFKQRYKVSPRAFRAKLSSRADASAEPAHRKRNLDVM